MFAGQHGSEDKEISQEINGLGKHGYYAHYDDISGNLHMYILPIFIIDQVSIMTNIFKLFNSFPYSTENDQSPGVYLRNLPVNRLSASNPSTHDYLANQSELR